MPEPNGKRIQIKDLPKQTDDADNTEQELTTQQAKAVNGGRLLGTQDPNLVGGETPILRTDSPSSDDPSSPTDL